MAVTSGFFNSVNHDRKYDADQIGAMFDGIIKDGVYSTIGNMFAVSVVSGMFMKVGPGRAWFDHTWTENDGDIILELVEAPMYMSRYDAIVLEVNKSDNERKNDIKVITGEATDTPVKPTMIKTDDIIQYPLCYISVGEGVTEILPENVEITVGTDECPICTGVLQQVDISELLTTWNQQFATALDDWETAKTTEFNTWFQNLHNELDENQAAHLQNEIDGIWTYLNSIGNAEDEEY